MYDSVDVSEDSDKISPLTVDRPNPSYNRNFQLSPTLKVLDFGLLLVLCSSEFS